MPRIQYPAHVEPVLVPPAPRTVALDCWFIELSRPVAAKAIKRELLPTYVAPVSIVPEVVDWWFTGFAVPIWQVAAY